MAMRSQRQKLRNRPLQVESLETLTLLSGFAATAIEQAPVLVSAPVSTSIALNGTAKGTFVTSQSNPDTGKDYHIAAIGRMNSVPSWPWGANSSPRATSLTAGPRGR